MGAGRVVSGCLATITVAGCALLVIGMARAGAERQAATGHAVRTPSSQPSTRVPAQLPAPPAPPASHSVAAARASTSRPAAVPTTPSTAHPATTPAHTTASTTPASTTPATSAKPSRKPSPTPTPASSHPATHPATHPVTKPAPVHTTAHTAPKRGGSLPLRYSTGSATRVITVVAHSTGSTTATLQAWNKAPGGGWLKSGHAVTAHVGSDGLSHSPSESRSATPIGSFSLTHAFGHYSDPGTRLPYLRTTPADWWISQPGRLYNTHQRCSSNCSFTQGDPNEHLYYETPFYNYAVVIDYNTRNAGPVRQGGGSAFFLHVTDGNPTAGCVAIPQSRLVPIMRWLTPSAHPRILIGVS